MKTVTKIVALSLLALLFILLLWFLTPLNNSFFNNVTLDQQLGLIYYNSSNTLAYNVTAVAQTSNGTGPAYILNGLSNMGYWYQLALSYNWTEGYPGFSVQFSIAQNSTSPSPESATNCSGVNYALPFEWSGNINPNDKVLLELSVNNGTVYAYAKDWNTGAHANATFNAPGATTFVGGSPPSGFFTGLMTEEYRTNPDVYNQSKVVYQPYVKEPVNISIFAEEFYSSCNSYNATSLYYLNSTIVPYNDNALISYNGVNVDYDNGLFTTGS